MLRRAFSFPIMSSALLLASSANAGFLGVYEYELDISGADFSNAESFFVFQPKDIDPDIVFEAGDSFTVQLRFAGSQSLLYTDIGGDDDENFAVGFGFAPPEQISAFRTIEFIGVEGDLLTNNFIVETSGALTATTGRTNLTDSSFSFRGMNALFVIDSVVDPASNAETTSSLKDFFWFGEASDGGIVETQKFELLLQEPTVLIANTNFNEGLGEWATEGNGEVTIEADTDTGRQYARMTVDDPDSNSPVELSQLIDTPDAPFEISFEFQFFTETGRLDVLLDDILIGSFSSSQGGFETQSLLVNDTGLLGLTDATLTFALFPGSPADGAIDNIGLALADSDASGVPIPMPAALLGIGLAGIGLLKRRKAKAA